MYTHPPKTSAQDLAAFNMPAGMLDCVTPVAEPVPVWPEHLPALEAFDRLATQWRVGMSGATGLDYGAVPVVFDLLGIEQEARRDRFDEIRIMEGEALKVMHEGDA